MHILLDIHGAGVRIEGRLVRIARPEGELHRAQADPVRLIEGLRRAGVRADLLTFLQKLPKTSPQYTYPMHWDNLAVLPISTFEQWWTKQVDNKTRNMVRKSERKRVVLREVPFDSDLAGGIWEIYNECPVRQGRRFPHFGKDFETVRLEEATFLDSSIFIGAFLDGKLIGFAKLVRDDTRTQAVLVNVLSLIQHRDKAPTNALIAHAVRACAERRIGYLVYSNFAYGKKQTSSLSDFKENNGFERVDLPRYYVPLTPLGWVAWRLGLHRSALDWVPEPAAAAFRKLRSQWYTRKFAGLENA